MEFSKKSGYKKCIYIYIYIVCLKTYITNFSPPSIKQRSSYQHGSKSEQVSRYPLLCINPRNAVINNKHTTMSNA